MPKYLFNTDFIFEFVKIINGVSLSAFALVLAKIPHINIVYIKVNTNTPLT